MKNIDFTQLEKELLTTDTLSLDVTHKYLEEDNWGKLIDYFKKFPQKGNKIIANSPYFFAKYFGFALWRLILKRLERAENANRYQQFDKLFYKSIGEYISADKKLCQQLISNGSPHEFLNLTINFPSFITFLSPEQVEQLLNALIYKSYSLIPSIFKTYIDLQRNNSDPKVINAFYHRMNKSEFYQIMIDAKSNIDIERFINQLNDEVIIIPIIDRNGMPITFNTVATAVKQIQEKIPKEQRSFAFLKAAIFFSTTDQFQEFLNYGLGFFKASILSHLKNFFLKILNQGLNQFISENPYFKLDLEQCLLQPYLRTFISFTGKQLSFIVQIPNLNPLCYKVIATTQLWDKLTLEEDNKNLQSLSPYFYLKVETNAQNSNSLIDNFANLLSDEVFFSKFSSEIQQYLLVDKELREKVLGVLERSKEKSLSFMENYPILNYLHQNSMKTLDNKILPSSKNATTTGLLHKLQPQGISNERIVSSTSALSSSNNAVVSSTTETRHGISEAKKKQTETVGAKP